MDALRSAVQPVTHRLTGPVRDLGVSLVGEACYRTLVLDVDVGDAACVRLAASKGLGAAIVAASAVVKLPQVAKLVRARSAAGVSFLSYLLETAALLITLAYNVRNGFPFSTYGESALIAAQDVVISLLVLHYGGRPAAAAVFVAVLAGSAAAVFVDGLVDARALGYLQGAAGVLGVASKLPQIVAIWRQGGTGQLSAFAVGRLPLPLPLSPPFLLAAALPRTPGPHLTRSSPRSSTTSSAPCRASSPPCKRWTTSSSCTASWRVLCSTPSSRCRWSTTGTRRRKRQRASARRHPCRRASRLPRPGPPKAHPRDVVVDAFLGGRGCSFAYQSGLLMRFLSIMVVYAITEYVCPVVPAAPQGTRSSDLRRRLVRQNAADMDTVTAEALIMHTGILPARNNQTPHLAPMSRAAQYIQWMSYS